MSEEVPLERRFAVLTAIARAQHFAWREAVRTACPGVDPGTVVDRMWVETGHQTARDYLRRLDPGRPLAPQVAACIAWSSRCMGEEATAELAGDGAAHVRHDACPWFDWHRRQGLLAEDRRGCDLWFATLVADIAEGTGQPLKVETLQTLPEGGHCCRRRLWVADGG